MRRALAAATGAFIPIWIAKRLRGRSKSGPREDPAYTKLQTVLDLEQSRSTLAYVSPAPAPVLAAPARTSLPPVSSLSSDSGRRGRYERLETGPVLPDAPRGGYSAGRGLQRNPSLVSALSSIDERRGYSTNDIPPPTPLSDTTPTFPTLQKPA